MIIVLLVAEVPPPSPSTWRGSGLPKILSKILRSNCLRIWQIVVEKVDASAGSAAIDRASNCSALAHEL